MALRLAPDERGEVLSLVIRAAQASLPPLTEQAEVRDKTGDFRYR